MQTQQRAPDPEVRAATVERRGRRGGPAAGQSGYLTGADAERGGGLTVGYPLGFTVTTPGGRLVFHVFGALAEFERDLIRERTMAGLAAARARGRTGGRPTVLTPEKRQAAQSMQSAGKSVAEIAKVVGVSRATLYRAWSR